VLENVVNMVLQPISEDQPKKLMLHLPGNVKKNIKIKGNNKGMNPGIQLYLAGGNRKPVKVEKKVEVPKLVKEKDLKDMIKIENIKSERESLQTPSSNNLARGNKKVASEMNQKIDDFEKREKNQNDVPEYKRVAVKGIKVTDVMNNEGVGKSKPSTPAFRDIRDIRDYKQTSDFLKDPLKATDFVRQIVGNNYDNLFPEGDKKKEETIYNFLQTLNKRIKEDEFEDIVPKKVTLNDFKENNNGVTSNIQNVSNVTISDFMCHKNKDYDEDKINKILNSVINGFGNDVTKRQKDEVRDNHPPVFSGHNNEPCDFDMCYAVDDSERFVVKSTGNNSERENNYVDSYENAEIEGVEDSEDEASDDEKVLVIRETKQEEKEKELIEMRDKFMNKIVLYKEQAKKLCGEKDYNKIFDYYMEINDVSVFLFTCLES
jgi:hypothetical protein